MDPAKLLTVQVRVTNNIINFIKNTKAKKGSAMQTQAYLEARLQLLHKYFNDLFKRHHLLVEHESAFKDHEYFVKGGFDLAEASYVDAVTELSADITQLQRPVGTATKNRENLDKVKLPRVSLPTFSGNPGEYESFKQRFYSLIGSQPHHSDVDKLQYLLGTLEGKAAARLKNIEIIGENYKAAWELLEKRFGHKRRLLAAHIEAFIQLKPIRARNAQDISDLLDKVELTVRALIKLGCDTTAHHWLVHCIVRVLDPHMKETWKISQESNQEYYLYTDLIKFLESRLDSLDSEKGKNDCRTAGGSAPKAANNSKSPSSSAITAHTAGVVNTDPTPGKKTQSCALCQADHSVNSCSQFNEKTPNERYTLCKKARLFINCLRKAYTASDCKSSYRCSVCKLKHHTKLHFEANSNLPASSGRNEQSNDTVSAVEVSSENSILANVVAVNHTVLLATANILVADSFRKFIKARALIDPGAQRSFISERVVQQLTLKRQSSAVAISGVGGQATTRAHGEVIVRLRSLVNSSFRCMCSALILVELTCLLPSRDLPARNWPYLSDLRLADPNFAISSKVDMILGADIYTLIVQEGLVRGPDRAPIAQSTVFGCVLTGMVDSDSPSESLTAISVHHTIGDSSLDQVLRKFWEIEEVSSAHIYSPEEEYCEQHFVKNYTRNAEGRFVVRLPFARKEKFIDSRDIAVACLIRTEKHRNRYPPLQKAYSDFMGEYQQLRYMRLASPAANEQWAYFLPHHAVFNKVTNKIRVVFNASRKGAGGYSLNDLLWTGRKLQADIPIVITLWRFSKVVMVTDIKKMFRQILVHHDDLDWQRLLWREDPRLPIQEYQALTVTYGTACAPFLANRALVQLAQDGQETHPKASKLLSHNTYVDDVFLGEDDEMRVREQRDELIALLDTAGMELGKWASNRPNLLQTLSEDQVVDLQTESGDLISTLGLRWDTRKDEFLYRAVVPPMTNTITKRAELSDIAKLYDPLGFVALILVNAKILLQDLWIQKLDWDAALPADLLERWQQFRASLPQLVDIRIPKWLGRS